MPFYIDDKHTYELYEYQLYIHITNKPDIGQYLLKKTGKKSLTEIDKDILEKLLKCNSETIKDKKKQIEIMEGYFNYVHSNKDIKSKIEKYFGDYSDSNLYYAIY